ncbi:MAG: thiol:disulfide interchange protein DsbA/DsbL [Granulosicoccus sp.]
MPLLTRRSLFSLVFLSCLSITATTAIAQSNPDGYETLTTPVAVNPATAESGNVEVVEFFWFGCPHCFNFEPSINEWNESKPDYVDFVREAPPFNPSWLPHSQAFYAAKVLGVTDVMFEPFFNAIHIERQPLRDAESISDFVATLGIDSEQFLSAMKSREVQVLIEQSLELAIEVGVRGVPSVLINGKYMTSNSIAGGHDQIIQAINTLTEQEKK